MNILVTGATGFIGKNLVRALAQDKNNHIICLVRRSSHIEALESLGVSFVFGDITDIDTLMRIAYDIDIVFHCAAYVDNRNRKKLALVNIQGTHNVLDYCKKKKVKRVVYVSSVAVTSGNPDVTLTEDLPYCHSNNYGWSKIEAEKAAMEYRAQGHDIVIVRPSMVYGPGEPHLMKYLLWLIKHRLFPLFNGGRQTFHLGYIGNVVDVLLMGMTNDKMLSGTYYIADKEVFSAREVIGYLALGLGVKPPKPVPAFIDSFLAILPIVGKRFRFFRKDRIYSTQALDRVGFTYRFEAQDTLPDSARNFHKG